MFTRLIMVIVVQHIQITSRYVAHIETNMLHATYTSTKERERLLTCPHPNRIRA